MLTGVLNRRSFDLKLDEEFHRARSRRSPLSLLMIDIDHFKRLNDQFGHPVGDETLRSVAQFLQAELRAQDCLFRYGGEEFAVLLPETSLRGAMVLGERFRRVVQRAPWKSRAVTVSIGAAVVDDAMLGPNELLQAGDRALYHAKQNGRNRVSASTMTTEGDPGTGATEPSRIVQR